MSFCQEKSLILSNTDIISKKRLTIPIFPFIIILMRKICFAFLTVFLFLCPHYLCAQTPTTEEERRLEKEKLQELEALLILPKIEKEKKIIFNWSGWFSSTVRYYEDTDNDKSVSDSLKASFLQDLRLWASWIIHQRHLVYIRFKNSYIQRNTGDGYTGIGSDGDGPHLDNAYLSLSLGEKIPYELTLGRQYLYIGRGISYSAIHDAAKLLIMPPNFFIKAFVSQALNHEEDIDASIPGYDKQSERKFAGAEFAWRGIKNNVLYTYFLLQRHLLDENPSGELLQSYNYNSEYLGLGLEGKKETISYWGELIKEYGKSYTDTNTVALEKKNIDAWAANVGLRKEFDTKFNPAIELEYAFGSGDDNRNSVTNTVSGNRYGDDENFLYFGDFFSGYAADTRLSNIHIYKLEGSIKPFPETETWSFNNINVGAKYFFYRKDQSGGATYDSDSTDDDSTLGHELNLYLYWKPTKNSNTIMRWGVFFPDEAYPDTTNDPAKYFYLRTTIYF